MESQHPHPSISGQTPFQTYSGTLKGIIEAFQQGNYSDTIDQCQKMMESSGFKPASEILRKVLLILARAYSELHKDNEAIAYLMKTLDMTEMLYGKDSSEAGDIFLLIAAIQKGALNFEESHKNLQKALDIYTLRYGDSHIKVADTLINLGNLANKKQEFDQSLTYYKKALEIYSNHPAEKNPNLAKLYNNMGSVYYEKGEYKEALRNFKMAKQLYRTFSSDYKSELAEVNFNLGLVYQVIQKYPKALRCLSKCLEFCIKHEFFKEAVEVYNMIGDIYFEEFGIEKAFSYFFQGLKLQQLTNQEGPETGITFSNIGKCYFQADKYLESFKFYRKSLQVKNKYLKPDDNEVSDTLYNLAICLECLDIRELSAAYYSKSTLAKSKIPPNFESELLQQEIQLNQARIALCRDPIYDEISKVL